MFTVKDAEQKCFFFIKNLDYDRNYDLWKLGWRHCEC